MLLLGMISAMLSSLTVAVQIQDAYETDGVLDPARPGPLLDVLLVHFESVAT